MSARCSAHGAGPRPSGCRCSAPTDTRRPDGVAAAHLANRYGSAAGEVRGAARRRSRPGRAARSRSAVHQGRGGLRGAPRDGDHARRRVVSAHPRPALRSRRPRSPRRRRRPPDRPRARLGRCRDRTASGARALSSHERAAERSPRTRTPGRRRRRAASTAGQIGDGADAADRTGGHCVPADRAVPAARRSLIARCRAAARPSRRRRDRRGEPRLVAAGHALVARRCGSPAGRCGVPADDD